MFPIVPPDPATPDPSRSQPGRSQPGRVARLLAPLAWLAAWSLRPPDPVPDESDEDWVDRQW